MEMSTDIETFDFKDELDVQIRVKRLENLLSQNHNQID